MNKKSIKILNFIDIVQFCTREQVQKLYFKNSSIRYCNRYMSDLVDNKMLKRKYYNLDVKVNPYIYYKDKKPNKKILKHDLLITDTIVEFMNSFSIKEIIKSPVIDDVKPDAMLVIRTGYSLQPVLVEVQLSKHDCFTKYYNFARKFKKYSQLDEKPILYVVTDLELNEKKLRDLDIVIDDLNMTKVRGILKCSKL